MCTDKWEMTNIVFKVVAMISIYHYMCTDKWEMTNIAFKVGAMF